MLDWQTEEDQTWDEKPQPQTAVSPWPRRFLWLLVVLLLGGGIWYAVSFLQQQIETATSETEADLRHAYGLLRQAAERQDTELFNLLLSGRDVDWARAQEQLLREGQLLDRPTWGLVHQPSSGADDPVTAITLSPDLLSAEVTAVELYQFWSIVDQQVKTVRLQQSAVYRLGPDRWLYAPPEADFWGETAEISGEYLHLSFPERDREVVEQLFPNLNALMANTCRLPGLACDAIRAEFSTNPATLGKNLRQAFLNPDGPILLPTPTLLGVPRDAEGYEFLWLAYGRYLSSHTITQQTGYDCCPYAIYYQILLHYQLAQLNLRDWPLPQAATTEQTVGRIPPDDMAVNQTLFPDGLHSAFTDLSVLAEAIEAEANPVAVTFRQIPPDLQTAYILIDYLVVGQSLTAADLQHQLNNHNQLFHWYNAVSPTPAQSETHLRLQLADHVIRYRTDRPQPEDSLTITCAPISRNLRLTYDPLSRTWQERALPPLPAILTKDGWPAPTPRQVYPTSAGDLYLVDSGDQLFLATADWLYPIQWDGRRPVDQGTLLVTLQPNGRFLNLTWEQLWSSDLRLTTNYQLDLLECSETGCPAQPAAGQVLWSPDGRHSLIAVNNEQGEPVGLYTGDEQAALRTYLDVHIDRLPATWLSNEYFAYATLTADETVQYNIQALEGQRPLTITAADLTSLLPHEQNMQRPVQPIELVPNPANPHHILLLAARPWISAPVGRSVSYEHYYLFWLELTADFSQIEQIALIQDMGTFEVQINPPGDLAILYSRAGPILSTLDLPYDPQSSGLTPPPAMPPIDIPPLWSPDGEWLALINRFGVVYTNPPTFDLVHLAPYDLSNCLHSQWSR
jgi:hypothetical protein